MADGPPPQLALTNGPFIGRSYLPDDRPSDWARDASTLVAGMSVDEEWRTHIREMRAMLRTAFMVPHRTRLPHSIAKCVAAFAYG